jgi:hypothetical protein
MRRPIAWTRIVTLALFAVGPACAEILDLPDPKLDDGVGGSDSSATSDGLTEAAADGSADSPSSDGAPAACDLSLSANCGACGNDCRNGACTDGLCTLADKAAGIYGAEEITIHDGVLYLAYSTLDDVGIMACPTDGCLTTGAHSVLYLDGSTSEFPVSIAADEAGTLFWTSYDGYDAGGLYRTDRDSGATTYLSQDNAVDYAKGVTIAGDSVLFLADSPGGAYVCAKTGTCGKLPISALGDDGRGVTLTDYGVVWALKNTLSICATPDCAAGKHALGTGDYPLVAEANTLYFTPFHGAIFRQLLDVDGSAAQPLVDKPAGGYFTSLLVVNGTLYWAWSGTDPNDGGISRDGFVRKCSVESCAGTTKDVALGQSAPVSLRTDGKSLYWATQGLVDNVGFVGTIMKAPL